MPEAISNQDESEFRIPEEEAVENQARPVSDESNILIYGHAPVVQQDPEAW